MLRVRDCIADRVRLAVPQPSEWQSTGDEINVASTLRTREQFFVQLSVVGFSFVFFLIVSRFAFPIKASSRVSTVWQRCSCSVVVHANKKLTAFVELETAIHEFPVSSIS